MSLVAAYDRDLVTEAPDPKLFLGTESLCFGGVILSLGSIPRSSVAHTRGSGVRFSPHVWRCRGYFMAAGAGAQPLFQARHGVRFFVDFLDFSIGSGTDK